MAVGALEALRRSDLGVKPLQDYLKLTRRPA
jgi:carbamoyl-phosphate synthase large subunit